MYYLRDLRGKAAKIRERRGAEDLEALYSQSSTSAVAAAPVVAEAVAEEPVVETATTEETATTNEA